MVTEADHNEEIFLRDCLALKASLERESMIEKAHQFRVVRKIKHLGVIITEERIEMPRTKDDLPRAQPCQSFATMPGYPRNTSFSDEVRRGK